VRMQNTETVPDKHRRTTDVARTWRGLTDGGIGGGVTSVFVLLTTRSGAIPSFSWPQRQTTRRILRLMMVQHRA